MQVNLDRFNDEAFRYFNRFVPDQEDKPECEICGSVAKASVPGFGLVCGICKPEVIADLRIDPEEVEAI